MALEELSLADLYLGWTLVFIIVLTPIALAKAPNTLTGLGGYLAAASSIAVVLAAWFAVPMWILIKLVT